MLLTRNSPRTGILLKTLCILALAFSLYLTTSTENENNSPNKSPEKSNTNSSEKGDKSHNSQTNDQDEDQKKKKEDKKDKKKKKTKRDKELEREEVTALGKYRKIRYRGKYTKVKSKAFDLYDEPIPYDYSNDVITRYNWEFKIPFNAKSHFLKEQYESTFFKYESKIEIDKLEIDMTKKISYGDSLKIERVRTRLEINIRSWRDRIFTWLETAVSKVVTFMTSRTITIYYDQFVGLDEEKKTELLETYKKFIFEAFDLALDDPEFNKTAFVYEKMGDDAQYFPNLRVGDTVETQTTKKEETREETNEENDNQTEEDETNITAEGERVYVKGRWEATLEEPPIYPENLKHLSYEVEVMEHRLRIREYHNLQDFYIFIANIEILSEEEVGEGKIGFVFTNREYFEEKHGVVILSKDDQEQGMYDFFDMIVVFRRHAMNMIRRAQTPMSLISYMKQYLIRIKKIHLMEIELKDIDFTKKEKKKKEEEEEIQEEADGNSQNNSNHPSQEGSHHSQKPDGSNHPSQEASHHTEKPEKSNHPSQEASHHTEKPEKSNHPSQEGSHHTEKPEGSNHDDEQGSHHSENPEGSQKNKSGNNEDNSQTDSDEDEESEESEPQRPLDDIDYQASLRGQKILEFRRMANLIDMRFSVRQRGDNEENVFILYNDQHWFKIRIDRFMNQYITIKLSNGYGDYHMTYSAIMSPEKLDEVVHHVLFYISNKIYRKNIAGCVWIMREIEKVFSIYPIENTEEIQDYFEMKAELVRLKKKVDAGQEWKLDYDPKALVEHYEQKKKDLEGGGEEDNGEGEGEGEGSQNKSEQGSNHNEDDQENKGENDGENDGENNEDSSDEEETNQKKINQKKKESMMYEQNLTSYYEAKKSYMEENAPSLTEAKFFLDFPQSTDAFDLDSNAMSLYIQHKVSEEGMDVGVFYFEESSLPGVLLQIASMENDFEYYIPLGDRYEITEHIRNIAKDLDDFFTQLVEEETKPMDSFHQYSFDDVKGILTSKLVEGKVKLCVIQGDDIDQPKVEELTEDLTHVTTPKTPDSILQFGDSDELLEGEGTTCPEDHKPRLSISLSQKPDKKGGSFTLSFIFPKCKNRLGADFSFRPVYPYDHKPLLEKFIQDNIEILNKKCSPEKVYVPGMTLFDDDDESEGDKPDEKPEGEGSQAQKSPKNEDERRLEDRIVQI
jgi:hypothetical protein